jgi:hypothetical protein
VLRLGADNNLYRRVSRSRFNDSNNTSCFALNPRNVFVNPTIGPNLDLRLCTFTLYGHASPAIGAGVNFSYSNTFGSNEAVLTPDSDIFGQSRASRVDLGAVQATSRQAPPLVRGGSFHPFH